MRYSCEEYELSFVKVNANRHLHLLLQVKKFRKNFRDRCQDRILCAFTVDEIVSNPFVPKRGP